MEGHNSNKISNKWIALTHTYTTIILWWKSPLQLVSGLTIKIENLILSRDFTTLVIYMNLATVLI